MARGRRKDRIRRAVDAAEALTGIQFCVILCRPTKDDPRAQAERRFASLSLRDRPGVLLMVITRRRRIEILTSAAAHSRITDAACEKALGGIVAAFRRNELIEGLEQGIADLAAAAGPGREMGPELPDVVDVG